MSELFSDLARKAIAYSYNEAVRLNHRYIGTEHLLLGLICCREGRAIEVIDKLGLSAEKLKSSIEKIVLPSDTIGPIEQLPMTPRAKKALEMSRREARALKSSIIETEHILLGLLSDQETLASGILAKHNIDYQKVYEIIVSG